MSLRPAPLTESDLGFSTWHAYDPACKAELWSTCFGDAHGAVLFDPIDWPHDTPLPQGTVQIVRTNANHDRACEALALKTQGKITAQPREFSPIPLPGAGEGETAFFHPSTRTLVVGDALIHLSPQPLMLLPEKYCTNPTQLKSSLSQLLGYSIERIFFAHGAPILQDGQDKLRSLLT